MVYVPSSADPGPGYQWSLKNQILLSNLTILMKIKSRKSYVLISTKYSVTLSNNACRYILYLKVICSRWHFLRQQQLCFDLVAFM